MTLHKITLAIFYVVKTVLVLVLGSQAHRYTKKTAALVSLIMECTNKSWLPGRTPPVINIIMRYMYILPCTSYVSRFEKRVNLEQN